MTTKTKPGANAADVTINDSTTFEVPTRGFMIGTSGNVTVRMAGNQATVLFENMAAGVLHALSVDQIHSTGTAAVGTVTRVW